MKRWHYWAIALFLPGGALIALALRARNGAAPVIDYDAHPETVALKSGVDKLIGQATDQAAALRSGLQNDPLAARLLGVDYGLVTAGGAAVVAAKTAAAADLNKQIADTQAHVAYLDGQWAANRFGGVSEGQFASHVAQFTSKIAAFMAQLAAL